ncbi:hypothetical protein [Fluviicola taffensis]|uniref:hypothetical protein n=1 Tax=Fluviicola taffensis TaxID=191579 RepID=UPI00313784ED
MRLLLLAAIASVIGASTTYAHTTDVCSQSVYQATSDSLSSDSLQIYYRSIDQLSVFDLKKWHEFYTYRSRTQSSYKDKQILFYIEERLKVVK